MENTPGGGRATGWGRGHRPPVVVASTCQAIPYCPDSRCLVEGLMDNSDHRGERVLPSPCLPPRPAIHLLYSKDPEPAPSAAPEIQLPARGGAPLLPNFIEASQSSPK